MVLFGNSIKYLYVNVCIVIYRLMSLILQNLEWLSPSGVPVKGRSSSNTRVYVERQKNDSLLPLIIHSLKIEDSGNWTCKAGELNETIEILVGGKRLLRRRCLFINNVVNRIISYLNIFIL